jgi:hypothetical protein
VPSVQSLIYVRNAISNGQSANSAYRAMRQAAQDLTEETGQTWQGIGRQSFLKLYSETLAARNKVGNALDYGVDLLPDDTVMTNRSSRYSKGFITWLTIYTRASGETDIETEFFAVHSQEPITPATAFATAQQGFEDAKMSDHGSPPKTTTFIGATYSGTWAMQPNM